MSFAKAEQKIYMRKKKIDDTDDEMDDKRQEYETRYDGKRKILHSVIYLRMNFTYYVAWTHRYEIKFRAVAEYKQVRLSCVVMHHLWTQNIVSISWNAIRTFICYAKDERWKRKNAETKTMNFQMIFLFPSLHRRNKIYLYNTHAHIRLSLNIDVDTRVERVLTNTTFHRNHLHTYLEQN